MACFKAGATALGSSPEMTIALTCCSVRVVINGTWAAALALVGPTCLKLPFESLAAFCPPVAAVSKYGLLIALGKKAMFSAVALAVGVLPAVLPPPQAVSSTR